MDFWTVIGIISSLLGIFSFVKNDTFLIGKTEKVMHSAPVNDIKKIQF
jgi:hypothetical protein